MELQQIVRDFAIWAESTATPKTGMVTKEGALKQLQRIVSQAEADRPYE